MDGREQSPIVFIYTCPPGSKVKERMVYACFKKEVMDAASQEGGFEVAKKVCLRSGGCYFARGLGDADYRVCSSKHQVLRRSRRK